MVALYITLYLIYVVALKRIYYVHGYLLQLYVYLVKQWAKDDIDNTVGYGIRWDLRKVYLLRKTIVKSLDAEILESTGRIM